MTTQFSMAKAEVLTEDFAMQHSQVDDQGLEWSFPKPNRTITVCGTGLVVSYLLYMACNAQLTTAVGICAVSGPVCGTSVGVAAGLCGLEAGVIMFAINKCYDRL